MSVEFDSEEAPAKELRREQCRPRAAKRVQDHILRPREGLDDRRENTQRLLRWVQPVAGIVPLEHIRNARSGWRGIALGEQVGVLMVVAQEALLRGIRLGERQVAAEMKPSRTP